MKTFNYSGNNLEGAAKIESKEMIKGQWSFKYSFGCVHVESWGKPFLVLTDHSYNEYGESWGYNYQRTGITFDTPEECREYAKQLNEDNNFPMYFNFSVKVIDLIENSILELTTN